ncbi:MAG: hypothetical protein EPN36_09445 [Rhodanobacteraceae bacterium]|nr:MAG: hypothetical protein EPN36_09445 [Rhodanobacteraceae bacterium]
MTAETLTALFLMLALGVRHGLDPEHIAIVNSVTLRAVESERRWPTASGLWFALGHGFIITLVAIAFVGLLDIVRLPGWAMVLATWLPTLILLAVAVANLRELMRGSNDYRPASIKRRLLPRALGDSSSPLAILLIGVVFAPFVDPASQAAVWGYVAGTSASPGWVALLGVVLTLAMAVTCTLEAHAVVRLTRASATAAAARRRAVGWLIVGFSFLLVGYMCAESLLPAHGGWSLRLLLGAVVGLVLGGISVGVVALLQSTSTVRSAVAERGADPVDDAQSHGSPGVRAESCPSRRNEEAGTQRQPGR